MNQESQDNQPYMHEGSFEDFKAWVHGMDEQVGNWAAMDEKVEQLCIDGEKILKRTETGYCQCIPRSRF